MLHTELAFHTKMYQNAHFRHKLSGLELSDWLETFSKGWGIYSAISIKIPRNLLHSKLLNHAANEQKNTKSAKEEFYQLLITMINGGAEGGGGGGGRRAKP